MSCGSCDAWAPAGGAGASRGGRSEVRAGSRRLAPLLLRGRLAPLLLRGERLYVGILPVSVHEAAVEAEGENLGSEA